MGASIAQVQSPQTSQPAGKGGNVRSDGLDQNAINADPQGFQQFSQNDSQQGYNYQPAQPRGKGGMSTNSATSGQPRMGQPNNYANTVGGWDNASIQPQRSGGKGKGY